MTNFSKYDFRFLIEHSSNKEEIIKSFEREPLPEILKYWDSTNKFGNYNLFVEGLIYAIKNQRYPIKHLYCLFDYPEFYGSLLQGLIYLYQSLYINESIDPILLINGRKFYWFNNQMIQCEYSPKAIEIIKFYREFVSILM